MILQLMSIFWVSLSISTIVNEDRGCKKINISWTLILYSHGHLYHLFRYEKVIGLVRKTLFSHPFRGLVSKRLRRTPLNALGQWHFPVPINFVLWGHRALVHAKSNESDLILIKFWRGLIHWNLPGAQLTITVHWTNFNSIIKLLRRQTARTWVSWKKNKKKRSFGGIMIFRLFFINSFYAVNTSSF